MKRTIEYSQRKKKKILKRIYKRIFSYKSLLFFSYMLPTTDYQGINTNKKLSPQKGFIRISVTFYIVRKGIWISNMPTCSNIPYVLCIYETVRVTIQANPAFVYISYILAFVLLCVLMCSKEYAHQYPTNLIILAGFTICFSISIAFFTSFYNFQAILLSVGLTAGIVVGLTAVAFFAPIDITGCGMYLFVAGWGFILAGLMLWLFATPFTVTVYALFGALLFSAYIVYDTQALMIGDKQFTYGPDDYVFATLNLYLDIINIFMYILQIVGSAQGGDGN